MKRLLQKIANTLMINIQDISQVGLFEGRIGIIVFFYHYGRFIKQPIYTKVADEMLDDVFTEIQDNKLPILSHELFEVGIGTNHLIKANFVEGDPDDILYDIDQRLQTSVSNNKPPENTQMLYWLCRWDNRQSQHDWLQDLIVQVLEGINKHLDNSTQGLAYYNCVVFLLTRLCVSGFENEIVKNVLVKSLKCLIGKDLSSFPNEDLIIFRKLLKNVDSSIIERSTLVQKLETMMKPEKKEYEIENIWQNLLYLPNESPAIDLKVANEYFNAIITDLTVSDLFFKRGLTGLGLGLIKDAIMFTEHKGSVKNWLCFFKLNVELEKQMS
ncbi:glycoside hydrolase family protein [Sunxiuqinia dokdonensis]|uniref:Uncharacterized protein n=1 Tax=Sunxiuqinia dokdonensis TaxID=1409788 RepID=A0A0L8V4H2_9BACT|nr:hypothetical protein [Sunxiuqinia dokdonensis]KOH43331.1 hypothetical protein NC99_38910 [Sunxiuqinia dokdonensis]